MSDEVPRMQGSAKYLCMKSRLMLYPCACFHLPWKVSDMLVTWGGYASLWCQVIFVLRHWTAEHGVQLCVGNKLLLTFLLTCTCGRFFSRCQKEKKDSLWWSKATRVYKTFTDADTIQQKLPQLFRKKMLCSSVPVLILYIWIEMRWLHFIDYLEILKTKQTPFNSSSEENQIISMHKYCIVLHVRKFMISVSLLLFCSYFWLQFTWLDRIFYTNCIQTPSKLSLNC